ncbi:MAG: PD-(D/E)XK nuclease family protein [Nitrososphaerota archaeon]
MQKIDHLSPTQIALFEMCGLAYKYTYIDKIPKPPPPPQVVKGSLIHYIIERKILDKDRFNIDSVIEAYKSQPNSQIMMLNKEDMDQVISSVTKAMEVINTNDWLPEDRIELVEQELIYYIDGIKIIVKPDIIAENTVYDHKVINVNSLFRYEKINYPDQLIIGAMATNKPMAAYNLFIEMKDGSFVFKRIKFDYIRLRYKRLITKIRRIWEMINNGMFYPVDKDGDNKWKCSPKYCDFYSTCEFGAKDEIPSAEYVPF